MNERKLPSVSEFLNYVKRSGYLSRIIYLGMLLIIIFIVWFSLRMRQVKEEAARDLLSVSSLKITQLLQWKNERLSESAFISSNQLVKTCLETGSLSTESLTGRQLGAFSLSFLNKWRYSEIFLLGRDSVLFSATGAAAGYDDSLKYRIDLLFSDQKDRFLGFYRNEILDRTCFDIYEPVKDSAENVLAVLLLRTDPYNYLFPLIQSWPTRSKTSENMLVQQCGDSAQVITGVSALNKPPMKMMIPLSSGADVAARVLDGSRGMINGRDYLNKRVLAYVTPLENTSWFFISKVDRSELLAGLAPELLFLLLTMFFLMVLIAMIFILSGRTREMIAYRELAEAREKQKNALIEQARLTAEKEEIRTELLGKLNEAQQVASIGSWEADGVNGTEWWSDEMYSLIESDHDLYEPGLAAIEALVFEEDRDLFHDQVNRKFEICEPFDADFRIVTSTGQIRFCNIKGRPLSPDQPKARGMMGTLSDITSRKSKEAEIVILNDRLHILVDALGKLSETRTLNALGSLIKNYAGRLVNSVDVKFIFREGDYFLLPGEDEASQGLNQKLLIGTDLISRVIIEGERLVIADILDIVQPEQFSLVDPSARSILVIPVSSESTTGAIIVCRPKPCLPSEMEIRVLESLSFAATIAIENIRFYTELEAMVNERTEQLSAVNRELESFTYSVSHDLRAPLRSIEGFVRILEEDYSLKLGPEGVRVCSIIAGSSRKMRNLIDNLLEFAKLGKQEIRKVLIDMNALAEVVVSELTSGNEQKNLDISIEKLPEAFGDPYMLHQVWTNYLSNAMKFSAGKSLQKIAVSGRQEEDRITYEVTDNGAGFDMEYSGKLFGVFQRLHTASEFEGTGVGLAIVQRIIHRHGGAVWAEGRTGEGARFSFSLPLVQ